MQSTVFYRHATQLLAALSSDRLLEILEIILDAPENQSLEPLAAEMGSLLFRAHSTLDALGQDPDSRSLILALRLEEIFDDKTLGQMITVVNTVNSVHNIRTAHNHFRLFYVFQSRLVRLKEFLHAFDTLVNEPRHRTLESEDLLTFEIIDPSATGLDLERLQRILTIIIHLHDTMARAMGQTSRLAIAYLDSGSGSLVSIKAEFHVIEGLRNLIKDIWDRVRFGKYEDLEKKLQTAEAGVKFVAFVEEQRAKGLLQPDAANQLKYSAVIETLNLFGNGATITDIDTRDAFDNRSLLLASIDVKLLGHGATKTPDPTTAPPPVEE